MNVDLQLSEEQWSHAARKVANGIRRRVLEHTIDNNGGYLSQACSAAETIAVLYTKVLHIGESAAPAIPAAFAGVPGHGKGSATGALYNGPQHADLDRFFFSPAHYALVLYAALIEVGRMSPEGLLQFNRDGGTVEMIGAEHSPGMELTTGSLAQGLSQAAGVALARKLRNERGRCVVYMSDGEFQEGQTWETFELLYHHRLDNVLIYVDVNGQQCDGEMTAVLDLGDLPAKLRSFGAIVFEVDGHDVEALAQPAAATGRGAPVVVLCRTDPCAGISLLQKRIPKLHYVRFRSETERDEYRLALQTMEQEGERWK